MKSSHEGSQIWGRTLLVSPDVHIYEAYARHVFIRQHSLHNMYGQASSGWRQLKALLNEMKQLLSLWQCCREGSEYP